MSQKNNFIVRDDYLNIYNINEYSGTHPTFNANQIMNLPIDTCIDQHASAGDILIYDGHQFVLSSGFIESSTGITGFTGFT